MQTRPSDPGSTAVEHRVPELHVRAGPMLIIVVTAALFALHETSAVCVPVLISIVLAYALEPAVAGLVRWHVPRLPAAILVYVLLSTSFVIVARGAREQVASFLDDLPRTVADIQHIVEDGGKRDPKHPGFVERLRDDADKERRAATAAGTGAAPGVRRVAVQPARFDVRRYIVRGVRGGIDLGIGAFVVALLTFLILVAGDLFKRKIVRLAGPRFEERKITVDLIRAIDRQIERYLLVRLIISAIVAGGTGVGLWAIGVNHPVVWGVVAGVLNVLPFAGPCLAIVLIALAALLQSKTAGLTLAAGGIASLVAFIEGNVLTPWLASRACELNTVAVFVSMLFWGWLWGIWGLLLAMPIMVAIKAAADRIEPLQAVGELLGEGTKT
jgi:predicted PurR-regulated permease PerM